LPIDPPPEPPVVDPPMLGEVVEWWVFERVDGTCDCCLVEWFRRCDGLIVVEEPDEEPDDIDGDEPAVPDDVWAKAVPAIKRAAAAVTISVLRIEFPFKWFGP
jgi:hypothetical protein